MFTGFKSNKNVNKLVKYIEPIKTYPATFDWREKSGVVPVRNQGSCGSCYAFSAVSALEGLYFAKNSKI